MKSRKERKFPRVIANRKATITTSIFFAMGIIFAIIVLLVVLNMSQKIFMDNSKEAVKGFLTLNGKLREYEDNMDKKAFYDDEVMFSMPKGYDIIIFNRDMVAGEEAKITCDYNIYRKYWTAIKGEWKEKESEEVNLKVTKPKECGAKSCICLADWDIDHDIESDDFWKKYREFEVNDPGNCFLYEDIDFKNTEEDTYVCDGVSFINSHYEDGKMHVFPVNLNFEGDVVIISSPILELDAP